MYAKISFYKNKTQTMSTDFDEIEIQLKMGQYDTIDFASMQDKLLMKYWIVIVMQFIVFEELSNQSEPSLFRNTSTLRLVGEPTAATINENTYLQIAETVKNINPLRMRLQSILYERFTMEERDSLWQANLNLYMTRELAW